MKIRRFIPVLLLCLTGCATGPVVRSDFDISILPARPYPFETYKLEAFIPAAMSLQAMGREAGSQALLRAARKVSESGGSDDYEKVVVLCRMLFKFKEGVKYRYPSLGERLFLGDTTYKDWPLEPIELVNGYPFCIVRGFNVGGARSPYASSQYVTYCITNCEWNTFKYHPLSAKAKRAALAKLLDSPKWKRPLSEEERKILSLQIE